MNRLMRYPDPECTALNEKFAKCIGVEKDEVMAVNGSDEILNFAFAAFCDKDKTAVFPDITYGFYEVFADYNGVPYRKIPLGDDFSVNIADYFHANATVFLANPNAPTGIALALNEVEEIVKNNPENIVVIDEAYVDFGARSAVELIHSYDNLVVVKTLSKSYSLAGARVGFALACPAIIADLNTAKFCFNPYNINRLSLLAGAAALRDRDYFHHTVGRIIANRKRLQTGLQNLGFRVLDGQANFLMAGCHPKLSAKDYFLALRERGILIRYFSQQRLADFVRITIGDEAATDALLAATQTILEETAF